MELSNVEFRVLLDLFMRADPWPLTTAAHDVLRDYLNLESRERGYDGWIEAYHVHRPKEVA